MTITSNKEVEDYAMKFIVFLIVIHDSVQNKLDLVFFLVFAHMRRSLRLMLLQTEPLWGPRQGGDADPLVTCVFPTAFVVVTTGRSLQMTQEVHVS